jgi:hypothetical protein
VRSLSDFNTELVHAGGDDPLVKQETMRKLNCEEPKSLSRKEQGNATSLDQSSVCPKVDSDLQISKSSRFVGYLIVKSVPQTSRDQGRQVRLKDCEDFLKKDSRFWCMTDQLRFYEPGPERTKLVDEFWKMAYFRFCQSERDMIRIRGRILSEHIALLDEERLECERSFGPSHVVDGGCDAQQSGKSSHLKCKGSYGPIHVEDGGGDALQDDRVDRSSPVQSQRFRAREGRSQC